VHELRVENVFQFYCVVYFFQIDDLTDGDLDYVSASTRQPLQALTHDRAPSQKRRPPSIVRRNDRESTSSDDYRETRRNNIHNNDDKRTIYDTDRLTSSQHRHDNNNLTSDTTGTGSGKNKQGRRRQQFDDNSLTPVCSQ